MYLSELADTSARVGALPSRNAKVQTLAGALRRLEKREAGIGVAYLSGRLPQGRVGVGPALVRQLLESSSPAKGTALTLPDVDAVFEKIAADREGGAARRRLLARLFARATDAERGFLARLLTGELRQGALEGLMIEAVAEATHLEAASLRRAAMLAGDAVTVAESALAQGPAGLARFHLQLFVPVRPMLALPSPGIGAALKQLGPAAFEYKLDGARIQVHKDGETVRVYSRRGHEVTDRVPEVVAAAAAMPARTLVLDGEAVALQPDGRPQPFQVTLRRFARRLDVDRLRRQVPLAPFFFDCLHMEDEDLIDRPAHERFAALAEATGGMALVPRRITAQGVAAHDFLEEAMAHGHEGLMAKALDGRYEAGQRGSSWLKLKPFHTLDLVVLAAEWGHGRRAGWLSNLHLGARNAAGEIVMLGKTFKGLTDATLAWQTRQLLAREVARDAWTVYVRPELVVEIAFGDVQDSPRYPTGLALRFARVKRYRPDKTAAEANTLQDVQAIHARLGRAER